MLHLDGRSPCQSGDAVSRPTDDDGQPVGDRRRGEPRRRGRAGGEQQQRAVAEAGAEPGRGRARHRTAPERPRRDQARPRRRRRRSPRGRRRRRRPRAARPSRRPRPAPVRRRGRDRARASDAGPTRRTSVSTSPRRTGRDHRPPGRVARRAQRALRHRARRAGSPSPQVLRPQRRDRRRRRAPRRATGTPGGGGGASACSAKAIEPASRPAASSRRSPGHGPADLAQPAQPGGRPAPAARPSRQVERELLAVESRAGTRSRRPGRAARRRRRPAGSRTPVDVLGEDPQHLVVGDALAVLDAGVEVGDQRDRGVAERQLAGQGGLGQRRSCRRSTSPAPACHSDSARLENRGPLTTTRVPPSTTGSPRSRPARQRAPAGRSGSTGRRTRRARPAPTSS